MLPGDKCSGVSELAEGYTYMRGRCKQLGGLQIGDREELECVSGSDCESFILNEGLFHRSESFDQRSEDICRRISMSIHCIYFFIHKQRNICSKNDLSNSKVLEMPIEMVQQYLTSQKAAQHRQMNKKNEDFPVI